MIKKIIFLLLALPIFSYAQFAENFESGDISSWTQSTAGRWGASTISPITGTYSLKHVFDNTADSRDQISIPLPLMDMTAQTVKWCFRLKHGYAPSSSNHWAVFLASSTNATGMFSGGGANGYVLGVNYTGGTDDILRLWKVTNGVGSIVITTSINWETQVGIVLAPAIEVVKNKDGLWQIRIDINGSFSNLTLVGEATDNTYTSPNFMGVYYKYSSTQDLKLWFDDLTIETTDTIKPKFSILNAKTSTNIETTFNEKMDWVSALNKLNYVVDGGIGSPDSIALNRTDYKTVNLFFNTKLTNQQAYQIQIKNVKDLKGNSINDTTSNFTYEYIKPLSLAITSSNQLTVTFSRKTNTLTAENPLNYLLDNSGGNPITAKVVAGDSTKVLLGFGNNFTNRTNYNLSIQNVADRNQDSMLNATLPFLYFIPQPCDLVINEIMADPTPEVNLPNWEYVEIHNTTPFSIDITGWKIKIGTTEKILTSYVMSAGSYLILCNTTAVADLSPYGPVLGISSFPAITNSSATITLSNNLNIVFSTVSFTTDWYNDIAKIDGGWSIERIDPLNTCSRQTNWKASVNTNGGTPGTINSVYATNVDNTPPIAEKLEVISANRLRLFFNEPLNSTTAQTLINYEVTNGIGYADSAIIASNLMQVDLYFATTFNEKQYYYLTILNVSDLCGNIIQDIDIQFLHYIVQPFDVVINEIMADPYPEVRLPNYEYIELFNTTLYPIDLTGWKLKTGSSEVTFPAFILNSGAYVILCSASSVQDFSQYGNVLGFASFPAISNSGTTITIMNKTGTIISERSFTAEWYNDNSKIDGGWSIERIDPLNTCSGIANWKASVSENGGTPGTVNSVYASNLDTIAPIVQSIEVVSANQLRIGLNEPVNSVSANILTNYSIDLSMGNPFSVILSANLKQIDLMFLNPFTNNTNYVLSVNNLIDECGNTMVLQEIDFAYYVAQLYDVQINEIMADPDPAIRLPAFEYIEIYNSTAFNISLSNWSITAGTTKRTIPSCIIEPGEYLTLCSDAAYLLLKDYGKAIAVPSFPALTNSGQAITLRNKEGRIISSVSYTDKWYNDVFKAEGGWSLEQIDPNNPCGGSNNWKASTNSNGGTPGQQNSIYGNNPDLNAPELQRATVVDQNNIKLFFNESYDSISAMPLSNYTVDNSIGEPSSITLISPDYLSLVLTFSSPFTANTIYNLEVTRISDCSGNEIGSRNSARFSIPVIPGYKDLVINEILFNPLSGGYDFVELYNRSQKTFDLKDLRIAAYDDTKGEYTSIKIITDIGFLVLPGEYVVLTENPDIVQQHYFTSNPYGFFKITSMPSYNDDLGRCILLDKEQNTIDNLGYNKNMQFALLSTVDGVSLERVNPDRQTDDRSNWHSASQMVGFATPAYKNSQFKELTESEDKIKVYPEVFSPDNDGFEDVVDIQLSFDNPGYVANIKIYDSRGRLVKYLSNNLLLGIDNTISWDGLSDQNQKLPKGIYIIYLEIFNLKGNVTKYRKPVVIAEKL